MRSEWIPKGEFEHILSALTPINRLVCEVSLATGLRVSDVLMLTPEKVRKQRFTIREEKTGKTRLIRLPKELLDRCISCSGQHYVFEHRINGRQHRTRQAVFKDLKKVCKMIGVKENLSPHSARKIYAVEEFNRSKGNLKKVQKLLNHDNEAVTMLYAMANIMGKKKRFERTDLN
jgi:integrase